MREESVHIVLHEYTHFFLSTQFAAEYPPWLNEGLGSLFDGRVEGAARVGNHDAIVPSISGWARQHGINTIFVDERDPFAHGFQVA